MHEDQYTYACEQAEFYQELALLFELAGWMEMAVYYNRKCVAVWRRITDKSK